jgi:hypothetical protein
MKNSVKDNKAFEIVMSDKTFQAGYKDLRTQKESTAESYKYGLVLYCKFTEKKPLRINPRGL